MNLTCLLTHVTTLHYKRLLRTLQKVVTHTTIGLLCDVSGAIQGVFRPLQLSLGPKDMQQTTEALTQLLRLHLFVMDYRRLQMLVTRPGEHSFGSPGGDSEGPKYH